MSDETQTRPWPDPTPEMLGSPEFEAVWQAIKDWDIHVPGTENSTDGHGRMLYGEANGSHVRAILDALLETKGEENISG